MARNRGRPRVEGLKLAESSSVNETPEKVSHQPERGRELAWCSSYSFSGSRCHGVKVGPEGPGS